MVDCDWLVFTWCTRLVGYHFVIFRISISPVPSSFFLGISLVKAEMHFTHNMRNETRVLLRDVTAVKFQQVLFYIRHNLLWFDNLLLFKLPFKIRFFLLRRHQIPIIIFKFRHLLGANVRPLNNGPALLENLMRKTRSFYIWPEGSTWAQSSHFLLFMRFRLSNKRSSFKIIY